MSCAASAVSLVPKLERLGGHLVVDGLVTLLDRGRTLIEGEAGCQHRHYGQQGQDRDAAPPPPVVPAGGVVSGVEERLLVAGSGG